jgi:hypothetical protein
MTSAPSEIIRASNRAYFTDVPPRGDARIGPKDYRIGWFGQMIESEGAS